MYTSRLSKVRGGNGARVGQAERGNGMLVDWWYICFFALGICCGWAAVKGLNA